MRGDRSQLLQDDAIAALGELMIDAVLEAHDISQLEREHKKVVARLPREFPAHRRAVLDGYWMARLDELYRRDLIYGAWWAVTALQLQQKPELQDRVALISSLQPYVFVSTHSRRDDFFRTLGLTPQMFATGRVVNQKGYYWPADGRLRPRPLPFYLYETTEIPRIVDL